MTTHRLALCTQATQLYSQTDRARRHQQHFLLQPYSIQLPAAQYKVFTRTVFTRYAIEVYAMA